MDQITLDGILRVGGVAVGVSIFGLAVSIGALYSAVKFSDRVLSPRLEVRDRLMPLYERGEIKTEPTMFNAYRLMKEHAAQITG